MEKKYIIKLKENEIAYKTVNSNGCPMIGLLHPAPYTEPDLEQVRKEAYKDGYDAGFGRKIDASYQEGLSDAWDAARKITQVRKYGGYGDCLGEVFGRNDTTWDVFDYSATEAIEKIRQYEQEQKQEEEQIRVGDEVISPDGKAVVTEINDRIVRIMYSNGSGYVTQLEELTRTGRHFDEIAAVLEKMRGEQDG